MLCSIPRRQCIQFLESERTDVGQGDAGEGFLHEKIGGGGSSLTKFIKCSFYWSKSIFACSLGINPLTTG